MKVHLDEKADALYLRIDEAAIVESEEIQPGVVLDFNAAGLVLGSRSVVFGTESPRRSCGSSTSNCHRRGPLRPLCGT